jgi:putative sigma-54 modulation protein
LAKRWRKIRAAWGVALAQHRASATPRAAVATIMPGTYNSSSQVAAANGLARGRSAIPNKEIPTPRKLSLPTSGGVVAVQIKVSVRHGHLSDDHQQQIRAKAEKLLHYFSRLTQIEVIIDLKRENRKDVEFHAWAEHKHEFVAHDSNADLMAAIDLGLDKVVQQIHRYKEKIQDHRRDVHTGKIVEKPDLESADEP